MVLSFPERPKTKRVGPHEPALAALSRAIERACPLLSVRTLPNELRVLLTRLKQPRKHPRSRGGDVGILKPDSAGSRTHPG